MVRWFAFALSLPLLLVGSLGLGQHFAKGAEWIGWLEKPAERLLYAIGLSSKLEAFTTLVPASIGVGFGFVFLVYALWPRGAEDFDKALGRMDDDRAKAEAAQAEGAQVPDRLRRKAEKKAASMAKKGHLLDAAELCHESDAPDAAVKYYVEAGDLSRAAEVRLDQNLFEEAADLYIQDGQYDSAASLYAARNDYEKGRRLLPQGRPDERRGRDVREGGASSARGRVLHALRLPPPRGPGVPQGPGLGQGRQGARAGHLRGDRGPGRAARRRSPGRGAPQARDPGRAPLRPGRRPREGPARGLRARGAVARGGGGDRHRRPRRHHDGRRLPHSADP